MRYGTYITAAVLLLFSAGGVLAQSMRSARPDSLFWRITGNGLKAPSYLMGTFHVHDKRAFRFGDSVLPALANVQGFASEARLDSALALLVGADNLPTMISIFGIHRRTLKASTDLRDDYPMFLDEYLDYEAKRKGASIYGLESSARSSELVDSVGRDIWRFMWSNGEMVADASSVAEAYAKRDMSFFREQHRHHKSFVIRSMPSRNRSMDSSMHLLMQQQTMFFAVGVLHLVGPSNLIDLLRQRGYTVEPVRHAFTRPPPSIADMMHRDVQRRWGPDSAYSIVAPGELISIPKTETSPPGGVTTTLVTVHAYELYRVSFVPDMEVLGLESEQHVASYLGLVDDETAGTMVDHNGRTCFIATTESDEFTLLHGVMREGSKAVCVTAIRKDPRGARNVLLDMLASVRLSSTTKLKTIGTWDDPASGLRFRMPLPMDRITSNSETSSFESMDPVNRVNINVRVFNYDNGVNPTSIDNLLELMDWPDIVELRRDTLAGSCPALWFRGADDYEDETSIGIAILRSSVTITITINAATSDGLRAGLALIDSITARPCCDKPWERRRLFDNRFEYTGPEVASMNTYEGDFYVHEPTTGIVVTVKKSPLGPLEPAVNGSLRQRLESVLLARFADSATIQSAVFHDDRGVLEYTRQDSALAMRVLLGVADRNAIVVSARGMKHDVNRPEIDAMFASCIVRSKPGDRPFEMPSTKDLLTWLDQADRGLAHSGEVIPSYTWRAVQRESVPALLAYLSHAARQHQPSRFTAAIVSACNDLDSAAVTQWARTDIRRMDPEPRLHTLMTLAELRSRSGAEALAGALQLIASAGDGFEDVSLPIVTYPNLTFILEQQSTDDLVRLAPFLPPLTAIPIVRAQVCSAGVTLLKSSLVDRSVLYPMAEAILARPVNVRRETTALSLSLAARNDLIAEIRFMGMFKGDQACEQRIRAHTTSADEDIALAAIESSLGGEPILAEETITRCATDPVLRAWVIMLMTTEEMYAMLPPAFRTRAQLAEAFVAARFHRDYPGTSIRVRPLTIHTRNTPSALEPETWVVAEVLPDRVIKRFDDPDATILAVVGPFTDTEEVPHSHGIAQCSYGSVPIGEVMSTDQIESLIRITPRELRKRWQR